MDASAFSRIAIKLLENHPAIMTLPATKNHMVFRINQSLSTNRSGTGLLKTEDGESNPAGDFKTEISGKITHAIPNATFLPQEIADLIARAYEMFTL